MEGKNRPIDDLELAREDLIKKSEMANKDNSDLLEEFSGLSRDMLDV